MAKAKKLPSGNWRIQVYTHRDEKGRIHRKSFTASTKAEAEMLAAQFKNGKHTDTADITVYNAVQGYIDAKEPVLSPSTVRGYRGMMPYYTGFNMKIKKLTTKDMQVFISDLSLTLSPKTVRNIYALLLCAVQFYNPDATFKVTMPQKKVNRKESPSDEDIKRLYDAASDQMKLCILLGMRGIRRGEICALKYEDIKNGVAHIHSDKVKNADGKWIIKEIPKNSTSDRFIPVPIGSGTGFIISWTPDSITKRFIELRNSLGLSIRFHDLRVYFASTAAVLQVPDIYTSDLGGWKRGGGTMKKVYQNNIKSMSDYYSKKIETHLQDVIS